MSHLWTTDALVAAMGGRPLGNLPDGVGGISIDSRSLQPGDAFFAIKGDQFDGHDFATAAVHAGAALMVVAEAKLPALGRIGVPMIVVSDVLAALEKAGIAARARSKAKIIAVTGSVGKTSTKEALRHALGAVGTVHASPASFNNHWGVPLTLARLPESCDFAVFEIGMNHPGEIRPLVRLVRPHVAVVTLIAAAHLGHFRDLEAIAHAKAEIFEGLERDGVALLNRDDPQWPLLERLARGNLDSAVAGFGEHPEARYRLIRHELFPDRSRIVADIAGTEIVAEIGAPGRHVVQNALAVLGAAHLAGADVGKVAAALATLSAERGRGQRHSLRHPDGEFTLIDESYNANPASMRAALALLGSSVPPEGGRRIAVLGDMLELGETSPGLHADLADAVAGTDLVFLAGPDMKALADALLGRVETEYRDDADALRAALTKRLRPGDVVMIKASKGIGFSKLVDELVKAYPASADASPH